MAIGPKRLARELRKVYLAKVFEGVNTLQEALIYIQAVDQWPVDMAQEAQRRVAKLSQKIIELSVLFEQIEEASPDGTYEDVRDQRANERATAS